MTAVQLALDVATPRRTWADAQVGDRVPVRHHGQPFVCVVAGLVQVPGAKEWIAHLKPEGGGPTLTAWCRWKDRLEPAEGAA